MIKVVDRIERPRREAGSDWDSARFVLARKGKLELWWWSSGKTWKSLVDGYKHFPGTLVLVELRADGYAETRNEIHEGGRLSISLLKQLREPIEEWFSLPGLVDHLHPRKTVLVERG